jgi:hypothetical protein
MHEIEILATKTKVEISKTNQGGQIKCQSEEMDL